MIQRLKPKSEFSRNVLTLMTGTTIAQAIPIAISPILTRIYTPEDFGLLALFVAITSIFGSIANGRYELAIMLPEKDEDAINIAALSLLIAIVFSVLLLILVIFFNNRITGLMGNSEIGLWLYFVPFVVFMTGLYNVLNYLNIRKKLYIDIARANIYKSVGMAMVQIGVGIIKTGASGLLLGQIVSHFISNLRLGKNTLINYNIKNLSWSIQKKMAIKYIKFPKYSLWAGLANTSSAHVTSILVYIVYNLSTLGFYSLTQRAMAMPASLIGSAIGQVFFQEASEEKKLTGTAVNSFKKTLRNLFFSGALVFFVLFWFVEDIFTLVFGEEWRVAGHYAKILIPLFFVQFFVSPLTMMNVIFNKNEVGMYWQFILLFLQLTLIFIAHVLSMSFESYLNMMVVIISLHYLLILLIMSKYNHNKLNV